MSALLSFLTLEFVRLFWTFLPFPKMWFSGGLPEYRFPEKPAILTVRNPDGSPGVEKIDMQTLLKTRCQSLFTSFKPLWWLFNGHLQTLYCVFGDFSKRDHIVYSRTYLRLADGGTLGLDFTGPENSDAASADDTPVVVVQHGLTGGSYEPYVRAVLSRACAPLHKGGLGYRAVVINFRGCAGVPVTTPLLYSAGHTDDTRQALAYISTVYPKAPLLGLGFSLGSNVLTRYLGEDGPASRLHACCALACPWDLAQNGDRLTETFVGKHVYAKGMGGNLLRLLKHHSKVFLEHPDPDHPICVAARKVMTLKSPTLDEFDNTFTCIGGGPPPHFPFPNAKLYYKWGSSHKIISQITVPFLALNADDDPIVQFVPMDGCDNGQVAIGLTKGGGHLGWFQAGAGFVDRWTTKPILEWLKVMGKDVVHDENSFKRPETFVDENGFLRERGREHLGCKVIDEGELVDETSGYSDVLQGL